MPPACPSGASGPPSAASGAAGAGGGGRGGRNAGRAAPPPPAGPAPVGQAFAVCLLGVAAVGCVLCPPLQRGGGRLPCHTAPFWRASAPPPPAAADPCTALGGCRLLLRCHWLAAVCGPAHLTVDARAPPAAPAPPPPGLPPGLEPPPAGTTPPASRTHHLRPAPAAQQRQGERQAPRSRHGTARGRRRRPRKTLPWWRRRGLPPQGRSVGQPASQSVSCGVGEGKGGQLGLPCVDMSLCSSAAGRWTGRRSGIADAMLWARALPPPPPPRARAHSRRPPTPHPILGPPICPTMMPQGHGHRGGLCCGVDVLPLQGLVGLWVAGVLIVPPPVDGNLTMASVPGTAPSMGMPYILLKRLTTTFVIILGAQGLRHGGREAWVAGAAGAGLCPPAAPCVLACARLGVACSSPQGGGCGWRGVGCGVCACACACACSPRPTHPTPRHPPACVHACCRRRSARTKPMGRSYSTAPGSAEDGDEEIMMFPIW